MIDSHLPAADARVETQPNTNAGAQAPAGPLTAPTVTLAAAIAGPAPAIGPLDHQTPLNEPPPNKTKEDASEPPAAAGSASAPSLALETSVAEGTPARPSPAPSSPQRPPIPPPSAHIVLDQHLARSTFKQAHHQLREKAYWDAFCHDHPPQTAMEKIWLRNIATLQVDIDAYHRALSTDQVLLEDDAAREVLLPGYHAFTPSGPRYAPTNPVYEAFMDTGGRRVFDLDPAEARRQAQARLAEQGVAAHGLADVAVNLSLPEIERTHRIIAGLEACRNRMYQDFVRSVESRERRASPPIIDAEFVER